MEAQECWQGSQKQKLKFWRDILTVWVLHENSKLQDGILSPEHQNQEMCPHKLLAVESNRVSVLQWKVARNAGTVMKGQYSKFCLLKVSLGSGRGRAEWTRTIWGESWLVTLGREIEVKATWIPKMSHSRILQKPYFSGRPFPSMQNYLGGGGDSLPIGNPLTPPMELTLSSTARVSVKWLRLIARIQRQILGALTLCLTCSWTQN